MRIRVQSALAGWLLTVLELAVAAGAEVESPRYTSLLRLPEAVTLATLSNGLTVIVQENHAVPIATVRCFVKNTGSAYESKNLGAGLSHVLEHVVAGGSTSHRTEKEIEKIIDTFGGATNAATSTDLTTYFIDCPARTRGGHRANSRRHAAREVRAGPIRSGVEGCARAGRQEVNRQRVFEAAAPTVYDASRPPSDHRLSRRSMRRRTRPLSTSTASVTFPTTRCSWSSATWTQQVLDAVANQYAGTPRAWTTCRLKTSRSSRPARRSAKWTAPPTTWCSPGRR